MTRLIADAVDSSNWLDASTSKDPEYELFAPGSDAYNYYLKLPNYTVADYFKDPSTKAEAAINGSALAGNIYFDAGWTANLSTDNAAALLMHEVLHTLGYTDPQIQTAIFGASSQQVDAASDNITQKFLTDCFTGK